MKSGSEFREFSQLTVRFPPGNTRPEISVHRHEVNGTIPPDREMKAIVDMYLGKVISSMKPACVYLELERVCQRL